MNRPALVLTLALSAVAGAADASRGTPATTLPLPPAQSAPSGQPLQRQTGMHVIDAGRGQRIIIRSVEPDSLVGGDRLDFGVLDANADGFVDRAEARADRSLLQEFGNVDANADGRLDREELAGWIL